MSNYLDRFNKFKFNEVKLMLDKQELTPDVLDFSFNINSKINAGTTADVHIYNFDIPKISSLEIYCNNVLSFASKEDFRAKEFNEGLSVDINVSEVDIVTTVSCERDFKKGEQKYKMVLAK